MKIIVDEMPKSAEDCVFGTGIDGFECVINNRERCDNSDHCPYLKTIKKRFSFRRGIHELQHGKGQK